jgi:hypothetical protein
MVQGTCLSEKPAISEAITTDLPDRVIITIENGHHIRPEKLKFE